MSGLIEKLKGYNRKIDADNVRNNYNDLVEHLSDNIEKGKVERVKITEMYVDCTAGKHRKKDEAYSRVVVELEYAGGKKEVKAISPQLDRDPLKNKKSTQDIARNIEEFIARKGVEFTHHKANRVEKDPLSTTYDGVLDGVWLIAYKRGSEFSTELVGRGYPSKNKSGGCAQIEPAVGHSSYRQKKESMKPEEAKPKKPEFENLMNNFATRPETVKKLLDKGNTASISVTEMYALQGKKGDFWDSRVMLEVVGKDGKVKVMPLMAYDNDSKVPLKESNTREVIHKKTSALANALEDYARKKGFMPERKKPMELDRFTSITEYGPPIIANRKWKSEYESNLKKERKAK